MDQVRIDIDSNRLVDQLGCLNRFALDMLERV